MSKPRIIKDYDKLSEYIQEKTKLFYPNGFDKKLILFKNAKNKLISALPFEGEQYYYLIKMTKQEAQKIISLDEDYGEDGLLKEESSDKIKAKHKAMPKKEVTELAVAEKAKIDEAIAKKIAAKEAKKTAAKKGAKKKTTAKKPVAKKPAAKKKSAAKKPTAKKPAAKKKAKKK